MYHLPKKHFEQFVSSEPFTLEMFIEACKNNDSVASKKIAEAYENKILDMNNTLMNLRELNISLASKMTILNLFDTPPHQYNKFNLTKLMSEYMLWAPFKQGYDDWLLDTWVPLTKYSQFIGK